MCLDRIDKCCCCVDHREGVKVLGVLFFTVNCLLCLEQILTLSVFGIFVQIALAVSSLSLLHGAVAGKRVFFVPWLLSYAIYLLGTFAYETYSMIEMQDDLVLLLALAVGPFIVYAMLVVLALYKKMGPTSTTSNEDNAVYEAV